jgi:excinuclease UvrABC nuclease subunit
MAKKTVPFNRGGASRLPDDKPVVYKIKTAAGRTNYVGVAKKGRVTERIQEHLDEGKIPGAQVEIEQMSSIEKAREKEQNIICRTDPKYNKQGN